MGFVTGLLGGFTLTSSILYLTLSLHQQNRQQQALMLRQQSIILTNVVEPPLPEPQVSSREARISVVESAKDRWNSEIERLVKKAQTTDWNQVGGRAADGLASLWSKATEKAKESKS
ncbi:hypothetical protein FKW77_007536 [Venturia effusa]|uniref:MICOS complex subunit MIC12 n=1 Tax=Venturia effusa TaxID=50376 RepID=A0A517LLS3_9PEZI|nr:hypothetical protein FKW77_007536 [Venturia effusa]